MVGDWSKKEEGIKRGTEQRTHPLGDDSKMGTKLKKERQVSEERRGEMRRDWGGEKSKKLQPSSEKAKKKSKRRLDPEGEHQGSEKKDEDLVHRHRRRTPFVGGVVCMKRRKEKKNRTKLITNFLESGRYMLRKPHGEWERNGEPGPGRLGENGVRSIVET